MEAEARPRDIRLPTPPQILQHELRRRCRAQLVRVFDIQVSQFATKLKIFLIQQAYSFRRVIQPPRCDQMRKCQAGDKQEEKQCPQRKAEAGRLRCSLRLARLSHSSARSLNYET